MGIRSLLVVLMGLALVSLTVGCAGPAATPTPQATPTPMPPTATPTPAPRTISGRISYSGQVTASHQIIVVAGRGDQQGQTFVVLSKPGSYTLSDVADGTYMVIAFMDLGDDMGPPQPNEPTGSYDLNGDGKTDAVVMSGGKGVIGIDITLKDPK